MSVKPTRPVKHSIRDRLPFGDQGPCPQLAHCQACPLLPLPLGDQVSYKVSLLRSALDMSGVNGLESLSITVDQSSAEPNQIADESRGYRFTAKPSVRRDEVDHRLKIGLYQPGSHTLIDLEQCWVQSPLINEVLDVVKTLAPQYGVYGYSEGDEATETDRSSLTPRGSLRYLVVRQGVSVQGDPTLYLTLVFTEVKESIALAFLEAIATKCSVVTGAGVHLNRLSGNAIFDASTPTRHLWGSRELYTQVSLDDDEPLTFLVSATSFAQVNPRVAERAYRAVVRALDPHPGERVIDLYCGVGVIGLMLARAARARGGALESLWGLEETPSSVADARENATRLSIPEANFLEGRAEERLGELIERLSAQPTRELCVALNPSRRGCQRSVLAQLAKMKPRRIAYMSCHARTLMRDLKRLAQLGYHARQITLFDMFPGSFHYETVTLLEPYTSSHIS